MRRSPSWWMKRGRGGSAAISTTPCGLRWSTPPWFRKSYADAAGELDRKFDRVWRDKVRQFQTPPFSSATEGAWTIRFDDVIADALELGPLRSAEAELPAELKARLEEVRPEGLPAKVLHTVIAYYAANRPEADDWVVLPVTNFDCYFGDTNFGRKYLKMLPAEVIERSSSFGISRYRVDPGICRRGPEFRSGI